MKKIFLLIAMACIIYGFYFFYIEKNSVKIDISFSDELFENMPYLNVIKSNIRSYFMDAPSEINDFYTEIIEEIPKEILEENIDNSLQFTEFKITKFDVYGNPQNNDFLSYRNTLSVDEKKVYDQVYFNSLYLNSEFEPESTITKEQFAKIFESVRYDNPEIFWLDYVCDYFHNEKGIVSKIRLHFNDTAENLEESKNIFRKNTQSVLEHAKNLDDNLSKMKFIHDILTNFNDYEGQEAMDQSSYSAIVTGKSVCAGYSAAFQYYMQKLGIPSAVIVGVTDQPHSWNLVELEDAFYEIDITWDDPVDNPPDNYYYSYFLVNDEITNQNRTRDEISKIMPLADGEEYISYKKEADSAPDLSVINYGKPTGELDNYVIWQSDIENNSMGNDNGISEYIDKNIDIGTNDENEISGRMTKPIEIPELDLIPDIEKFNPENLPLYDYFKDIPESSFWEFFFNEKEITFDGE